MNVVDPTRRKKNSSGAVVDTGFNKASIHGLPNKDLMKIWRSLLAGHISDTRMQMVAAEMHSRKILY